MLKYARGGYRYDVKTIIRTHIMAEGKEGEMKNQYGKVTHVVANRALHDILPSNIDMMVN